jgi:hypothetical protein
MSPNLGRSFARSNKTKDLVEIGGAPQRVRHIDQLRALGGERLAHFGQHRFQLRKFEPQRPQLVVQLIRGILARPYRNRLPAAGGAAGASRATRSTFHPISSTMHLIAVATPRATFMNGRVAVISLLPVPRGMSMARCVGMANGINGWPADTTQINSFLPTAHATSIPM